MLCAQNSSPGWSAPFFISARNAQEALARAEARDFCARWLDFWLASSLFLLHVYVVVTTVWDRSHPWLGTSLLEPDFLVGRFSGFCCTSGKLDRRFLGLGNTWHTLRWRVQYPAEGRQNAYFRLIMHWDVSCKVINVAESVAPWRKTVYLPAEGNILLTALFRLRTLRELLHQAVVKLHRQVFGRYSSDQPTLYIDTVFR